MPVHRAGREVEDSGNLRDGHADEVAQLHHFSGLGVLQRQGRQRVVDGQQFLGWHGDGDAGLVQFVANQVGAVFGPLFASGNINENLLHRGGGGLEEMPTISEVLAVTGDLQPGLMHESGRLQGLSGFLIGHPDDGELTQFSIDEREQLVGRLRIAPHQWR